MNIIEKHYSTHLFIYHNVKLTLPIIQNYNNCNKFLSY